MEDGSSSYLGSRPRAARQSPTGAAFVLDELNPY